MIRMHIVGAERVPAPGPALVVVVPKDPDQAQEVLAGQCLPGGGRDQGRGLCRDTHGGSA